MQLIDNVETKTKVKWNKKRIQAVGQPHKHVYNHIKGAMMQKTMRVCPRQDWTAQNLKNLSRRERERELNMRLTMSRSPKSDVQWRGGERGTSSLLESSGAIEVSGCTISMFSFAASWGILPAMDNGRMQGPYLG